MSHLPPAVNELGMRQRRDHPCSRFGNPKGPGTMRFSSKEDRETRRQWLATVVASSCCAYHFAMVAVMTPGSGAQRGLPYRCPTKCADYVAFNSVEDP